MRPVVVDHSWSIGWQRHAVKNRVGLTRIAYCCGWKAPAAVPKRPPASASDATWGRFGKRCKALAVEFTRDKRKGKRIIFQPAVRNWTQWEPTVRWYWPDDNQAWHCPACGLSGVGRCSRCVHTIFHESRGGGNLMGLLGAVASGDDSRLRGPANIAAGYRYYLGARARGGCGWEPWPWWR
jgi:hypothetical protein